MPETVLQFVCPCCGMHAPLTHLSEKGPYELQMYLKTLGGKIKLSEADRELRKGQGFRRGSAPGSLEYEEVEVTSELQEMMRRRLKEIEL